MANLNDEIKEIYWKEFDRTRHLDSLIPIPLGILTVLFGAIFTIATQTKIADGYAFYPTIFFCLISFIFSTISLNYTKKFAWRQDYNMIPYATQLLTYKSELNAIKTGVNADSEADSEATFYLHSQYALCADFNAKVNKSRVDNLHEAFKFLFIALAPLVIASIPVAYNKITSDNVEKIEIVNSKDLKMSSNESSPPPTTPAPTPAPASPPVPTPPPSRLEKNSVTPPVVR